MIFVLWPTIRPKVAVNAARIWVAKTKNHFNVSFIFGVNSLAAKEEIQAEILSNHVNRPIGQVLVFESARTGVTHTATLMTTGISGSLCHDGDIVVLASDDYDCPLGWDEYLQQQFKTFSGMLIVNDASAYKAGTNIVPIPICSGACLEKLNGILYNPAYRHFYSDQELFDVVTELGLVQDLRGTGEPRFIHQHWSFGGRDRDEFDVRNNDGWKMDKATYDDRKNLTVAEKLVLPEWFK